MGSPSRQEGWRSRDTRGRRRRGRGGRRGGGGGVNHISSTSLKRQKLNCSSNELETFHTGHCFHTNTTSCAAQLSGSRSNTFDCSARTGASLEHMCLVNNQPGSNVK